MLWRDEEEEASVLGPATGGLAELLEAAVFGLGRGLGLGRFMSSVVLWESSRRPGVPEMALIRSARF